MTEPILDKARAAQNLIERIANKIPGYAGYRERDLRRDADRLEREHLAKRLEQQKAALNTLSAAATRGGGLDAINDIETARKRLDKIVARVRYADRGYSGFFDAVKIDEAVLGRVYQFDLDLVSGVDEIEAAAQDASRATDVKAGVTALLAKIDAFDSHLSERESILSGVK